MREFPFDLDAAKQMPRLITLGSGAGAVRFTTWSEDITLDDETWTRQAGASVSNIEFSTTGDISNTEVNVKAYAGGLIAPGDVEGGKFTGAVLRIGICNPEHLDQGIFWLPTARVGRVRTDPLGLVTFVRRGLLGLAQGMQEWRYEANCIIKFGSDECRIPVLPPDIGRNQVFTTKLLATSIAAFAGRVRTASDAGRPTEYENVYYECTTAGTTTGSAPTYDPTVGNTTADGTAVFTARDSWARWAQVDTIIDSYNFTLTALPDPRANVDGWFTQGKAVNRTGLNAGKVMPIADWFEAELQVASWVNVIGRIDEGDYIEIARGCALTEVACQFYENILNNRAYGKFVPGRNLNSAAA